MPWRLELLRTACDMASVLPFRVSLAELGITIGARTCTDHNASPHLADLPEISASGAK